MNNPFSKRTLPLLVAIAFGTGAGLPAAQTGPSVTLKDFKLTGDLSGGQAAFTLSARAHVEDSKGATLELLSGPVALTELGPHSRWRVRAEDNRYVAEFEHGGDFPIQLKFAAAVRQNNGWNSIAFRVAPATLQQVVLQKLAAGTQFQFPGAARPERQGEDFVSFLPDDGEVNLSWKEVAREAEGKLFYAAEMRSQVSISPGVMSQTALLDFKVMQGEMSRVSLGLRGEGEVTRVLSDLVLSWNVEKATNSSERRLVVQLNQPQKDAFTLLVQTQTPMGAFPQTQDAVQLRPEGATRFAGYFRIVNEGAVRLEVAQAAGMSQISPEQFPESDATRAAWRQGGTQRFAYRFSGTDYSLRIQADQILPEVAVSEVLSYHHAENELAVDAEIELDVREAPLRELVLRVPPHYAVARLDAAGLSDSFLTTPTNQSDAELRLVYGQPVSGRQVIVLRLERNQPLGGPDWALPRIEVAQAKSVRGSVGVSSDAGFRLTPERTQALTEITPAFFPAKVAGLQAAFRLTDPAWQATVRVERLPQTIQADALHLFSIGEGIAYGSSVINYNVSGAPVSVFKVELSDEYYNVEFTGRDLRNWQRAEGGYIVQLHTPVSGAYTLLATYERPFKPQGETLTFTGARPLDAQTEQGHTLIISDYQFQVKPVDVSPGLLPLETAEVPPEYRLLFDAPVLGAYRYGSRPFNLRLALTPLAQGDSLNQVVDRASLQTRISKEGQVLTDARYFVKSRGNPNLRLTLPSGANLWSVTINGAAATPVEDGGDQLIPLPMGPDPDAAMDVQMKLAANSTDPRNVTVAIPAIGAPVMLTEWKLSPDTGQRLAYRGGKLTPVGGVADITGFAAWTRLFTGEGAGTAWTLLIVVLGLVGAALAAWRWAVRGGAHRYSARHLGGAVVGGLAIVAAIVALAQLAANVRSESVSAPPEISFLVPVQQAGSALNIEVSNLEARLTVAHALALSWPTLLALAAWGWAWVTAGRICRAFLSVAGWACMVWAALRWPDGAEAAIWVFAAFLGLHVVWPALARLWCAPKAAPAVVPPATQGGVAHAASLIIGSLLLWSLASGPSARADTPQRTSNTGPVTPESVTQDIRIEDNFAIATAKIQWQAKTGDELPLLSGPAVLTRLVIPPNAIKLVEESTLTTDGSPGTRRLAARQNGVYDVEVSYQMQVSREAGRSSLAIPLPGGLINKVNLTVVNADVDVVSPQAVSVHRELEESNTVAVLALAPADAATVSWLPRSRDVQHEKPEFSAEISQLYVPSAGVIEGSHVVAIRPAHGELSELVLDVPRGATVTDVLDFARSIAIENSANANGNVRYRAPIVSLWRFDPDAHKLRVTLNPAQSRPFSIVVRSQVATGPLPFEQSVGLLSADGATEQIGQLGIATGNEVQIDSVNPQGLSAINLEDFPPDAAAPLAGQVAGLTVRRAFHYSGTAGTAVLKAAAVEPDVRVETQDTLSLGEDRTVLASDATVDITRAGIFRLSFLLPPNFDVETISGVTLSHWTESTSGPGRVITLHLTGKAMGRQQFAISLVGPGIKATTNWAAPQLIIREAEKQRGTLVVAPEQGMRLQVASRDGVTQLDPQRSGIQQKGVLAFRVLQTPWNLALDIEQVDPWIQVTSLERASVNEAQVKILANLQYDIENTGLKTLRVFLPADAEGVGFKGDQVSDFLAVAGAVTNGMQEWEVKLQRRVLGSYLLQASCQTPMTNQASETLLRGVQAADVNMQRGFVTVQSSPRLQVSVPALPAELQPAEWQSIPRALQQDMQAAPADFAYRLVDAAFQLPLKLARHEAARLLPARVNSVEFHSVISDDGQMLTRARLEILPGDKRLLDVVLPDNGRFWFALVNQAGVWPWREKDHILIPLEQQSRGNQPVPVEIYYSSSVGGAGRRSLDLQLLAPKFDLPLEDITWKVALNEKWRLKHWEGALQLQEEAENPPVQPSSDVRSYLQDEAATRSERTRQAEQFLAAGNSALANGDPQGARRSFQAAFGLSSQDAAFNEDARVQLQNVKLQEALVGLNFRNAFAGGNAASLGGRFQDVHNRKEFNYTQQDAKDIMDRNSADENAAYMKLAERLVQQQDAAVSSASALLVSVPDEGRVLTFKRSVEVSTAADLYLHVRAVEAGAAPIFRRLAILSGTLLFLGLMFWTNRALADARQ